MSLTLELSPEQEGLLKQKAQDAGMTVEQLVVKLADLPSPAYPSIVGLQKTDPQEWARQFRAWADSHDPNTPVLSDEDMSRESIY